MPKKQDERRKDMTQGSTRFQVILATLGVAMALLLAALDQTVVGVAMPRIVSDLHGIELYAWVTTAYLITSTALVPVAGKLGDMFGRKPFMLAGMVGFIAASALCGLSQNMIELVLFRGLQGVFGGVLFASTFAVMTDLFPPEQRARMSGVFGAIFGLSSVIGPSLGGFLTDGPGWRWVFYVNISARGRGHDPGRDAAPARALASQASGYRLRRHGSALSRSHAAADLAFDAARPLLAFRTGAGAARSGGCPPGGLLHHRAPRRAPDRAFSPVPSQRLRRPGADLFLQRGRNVRRDRVRSPRLSRRAWSERVQLRSALDTDAAGGRGDGDLDGCSPRPRPALSIRRHRRAGGDDPRLGPAGSDRPALESVGSGARHHHHRSRAGGDVPAHARRGAGRAASSAGRRRHEPDHLLAKPRRHDRHGSPRRDPHQPPAAPTQPSRTGRHLARPVPAGRAGRGGVVDRQRLPARGAADERGAGHSRSDRSCGLTPSIWTRGGPVAAPPSTTWSSARTGPPGITQGAGASKPDGTNTRRSWMRSRTRASSSSAARWARATVTTTCSSSGRVVRRRSVPASPTIPGKAAS